MAKRTRGDFKRDIVRLLERERTALSADQMAGLLHMKKGERPTFLLALSQMERDGELLRERRPAGKKSRYTLPVTTAMTAKILSLSRGYAFARLMDDDGHPDLTGDCFIPGAHLGKAMPGDTVLLAVEEGDRRGPSGRVLKIVEKGGRLYSGRLIQYGEGRPVVAPDAHIRYDLPVKGLKTTGARAGDKVRFTLGTDKSGELAARLLTTYGDADSARVCADAIIETAGIPSEFPAEVLEEAEKRAAAGITEADREGRLDLREALILTIDGHDAKDLDDAVSLEALDGGWRLGVHIADVSHYVRDHTPLGDEAFNRGTSVYFADRVIPMLPEALSNGICSLNAGEDKLTLSVFMDMNAQGTVSKTDIQKTVIRSRVRGVYREVNALFDGSADGAMRDKYAPVTAMLADMRALAGRLREAAARRGTMDLESSEASFVLDEQGHPVDIVRRPMGEAEGMIEQFMIAANVATAAYARQKKLPFIYRVHEQPDSEKLRFLGETAGKLGMKTVRLSAQLDLRALMEEARETPYARLISDRLLRSMAKAKYSENPLGHYGLSLKDYSHFTSPIRRLPDLVIHRVLSAALSGTPRAEIVRRYEAYVGLAADQASMTEVRAMTAERDCEDCYKAEYMARFIGQEFDGVVASVAAFGLFVELENSVDGMVRLDALPEEGLRYDEVASLVNERGKPLYTIGDAMRIRVDGVDVSAGRVDFTPAPPKREGSR